MSLIALLSLSSSRSPSSSSRSPSSPGRSSKFADFYQRIPFHAKAAQRKPNSGDGGALKPQQQLQLKVYGTNRKSRYRSLLTGFSVDVVERFDRLLAPYSINASSSNASNGSISHPVLQATSDGLYAPQSSFSLFMDSLHFLPQAAIASSWRNRKRTMLATSAVNDNKSTSNSAANPPVVRQIELVALPRRRSTSRAAKHQDQEGTSPNVPKVVIPTRATRRRSSLSSSSRSPTSSRHSKPSELRRAIHANAQLSSALMNKKILLLNEASTTTIPTTSNSEISYEINAEELASRFYVELRSHDSRETTSNASEAFTPPKETKVVRFAKEIEDHTNQSDGNQKREDEWKAKQLDLERQVAALMAENQAKTALIKYLMDENSRIVGDCECGNTVKATISVESPEDEEIHHHHYHHHSNSNNNNNNSSSSSTSSRRTQLEVESVQRTEPPISKTEPESLVPSPSKSATVPSIEVQVAKRKLLETEPHVEQNQNQPNQIQTQNQKPAAHEALFEGLVSEIEAEFSQLFTCERSA